MVRRVVTTAAVLVAVQGLLVFAYLQLRDDPGGHVGAERLGGEAPAFSYETADGATRRLSALRGRGVVVHFWATWCGPCRVELPALLEFAAETDVQVLALSLDRDWDEVRAFFGGELPPGVVRTSPEQARESFGVVSLPETFVVDAEGSLRLRFDGARDWRSESLRDAVEAAASPR